MDGTEPREVPELKIPATPEVIMKGVLGQFMPVVIKCSLGGYIVIIPDKGISAWTSLEDAGEFLIDQAYEGMGEVRPTLPKFMQKDEERDTARDRIKRATATTLNAISAALVVALGVKIL